MYIKYIIMNHYDVEILLSRPNKKTTFKRGDIKKKIYKDVYNRLKSFCM